MSSDGSKGQKNKAISYSYIIGIVFLIVTVVLLVKNMIATQKDNLTAISAAPTPIQAENAVSSSASSPSPSPSPSPTPSPTPIPSTKPAASGINPSRVSSQPKQKNTSAAPLSDTEFKPLTKLQDDIFKGNLILVNNKYPYKFIGNINRVCLFESKTNSYKVSDYNIFTGEITVTPLNSMLDDFYSEMGTDDAFIISGYRSYETQQYLFDREIADKGEAEAVHWVARPGTSEHHTGLAIDFGILYDNGTYYEYDGTGDFAWINENCYKYGFIVRYQNNKKNITGIYYEPWHFRYVGIPHATKITELGLCLEEYIDYIRSYSYKKPLLIQTDDGSVYETYYCAGITAYVPINYSYEISGNNIDGFIVTVKIA